MTRGEPVTVADIAAAIGVSRQRVHQLRERYADFPEPILVRRRLLLFGEAQTRKWALKHGYEWRLK
jgi:hypothetical protein